MDDRLILAGAPRCGEFKLMLRPGLPRGVGVLDLTVLSGVEGLTLIAELRFTCSAPLCGRGLIALAAADVGETLSLKVGFGFCSFSSSSVMLNLRRTPA